MVSFFLQYCACSENIRFLNSDVCKAVQFDFTGEQLRLPNVRRWNYGNQYDIASFYSKARDQDEESDASPAKPGQSLQRKSNLRFRSLWNSLDTGVDIHETRYVQHAPVMWK